METAHCIRCNRTDGELHTDAAGITRCSFGTGCSAPATWGPSVVAPTFKAGDLIMNDLGSLAEVGERVARDPSWGCGGWRITPRDTGTGDGYGHSKFLADYLAHGWRIAPLSWEIVPRTGRTLMERWVITWGVWRRQVARADAVPCDVCSGVGMVPDGLPCQDCPGTGKIGGPE